MKHLYPYTNPHELNLDWIIDTVKQLGVDFETLKKWCEEYLDNLDISDDVDAKINEMAQAGTLTPMIEAAVKDITKPLVEAAIPDIAVPLINAAIEAKVGDIDTAIAKANTATAATEAATKLATEATSAANSAVTETNKAKTAAQNATADAINATDEANEAASLAQSAAERAIAAAATAETNFMNITVVFQSGIGLRCNYTLEQITTAYKKGSNITAHWQTGERIDIVGFVRNSAGTVYAPIFIETDVLNTPTVGVPVTMSSSNTDYNRYVLNASYDVYSGDTIIGKAEVKTGAKGLPSVLVTRTGEVSELPYIASCNDLITALSYIALAESFGVATGVTSLQIGGYANSQGDSAFLYNVNDSASTLTMSAAGTVWTSRYTFPWISIRQ